jgi:hypothetical protein
VRQSAIASDLNWGPAGWGGRTNEQGTVTIACGQSATQLQVAQVLVRENGAVLAVNDELVLLKRGNGVEPECKRVQGGGIGGDVQHHYWADCSHIELFTCTD